MARVADFPRNGGKAVRHGESQIAIFHFESRGEWYATQNTCPHRGDSVLARGLLGSQDGEPKIACPMHKKTFSLETGKGLSDPDFQIHRFPVDVREAEVWVKLPAAGSLGTALDCVGSCS
jgi:NAD(P)H-dependent nitrite reductase small subunit